MDRAAAVATALRRRDFIVMEHPLSKGRKKAAPGGLLDAD